MVNGQRIALLKNDVLPDLQTDDGAAHKKRLYQQVATELADDELAILDAGFNLVDLAQTGIERCLVRSAKNCTLGKTVGQIPERTSAKGRTPTQYQAEIVRLLARRHGDRTLPVTEVDQICTIIKSFASP